MSKRKISPRISITMAIIAFIAATIPAFGLVLKDDTIGRIIFAGVWILVGVGWLGHLMIAKKSTSRE
jgi:predicted membrane channel-forming protein YqfA (hemolysin III family)